MKKQILDVCDLSVVRSGKVIIRDVCLTINEGEFVAIVGPNGGGKSTFLLAILGLLKTRSGTIEIYGHPPMSRKLHRKIGWVSQAASHLPKDVKITVRELVKLGTLHSGNMFDFDEIFGIPVPILNTGRNEKVNQAIRMTGLEAVQNTPVARLSGGQRQRAVIARALATESDFILLDEPLVGIDPESRNSLLKLLDRLCHEQGKTILMVSHDLTAMSRSAHRIVFLEETIRFDGPTWSFPDMDKLADLRGIANVQGD
jgi:zinc transport system ATP-binding protein